MPQDRYNTSIKLSRHNEANPKYALTANEIAAIKEIIPLHSDKTIDSNNPYAELLKDADALDRYLHGITTKPHEWQRLLRVLSECGAEVTK